MNSDVIQFQCSACQSVLTVPSHLAGVTGPCPICGQSVTSPTPAAPSFAPSSFFSPPAAAAPTPAPTAEAPSDFHSPQGIVQPNLSSIAQYLHPLGGAAMPSAPAQQAFPPAIAQPWQSPGLGQTLITNPQPTFPGSAPTLPPVQGLGLPPRRAEGQPPHSGALPTGNAPSMPWGTPTPAQPPHETPAFLNPAKPSSGQNHSSLIPGSPTLPSLGGANGAAGSQMPNSLLARDFPAAQPTPQPSMGLNLPVGHSPHAPSRPRPLKKPSRASNVFMFGLAVLFVVGSLAAAGWLFREPILQIVQKLAPSLMAGFSEPESPSTSEPTSPSLPTKPMVKGMPLEEPTPPPAVASAPVIPDFDPEEKVIPKAQPATAEDLAALPTAPPLPDALPEIGSVPMAPALNQSSDILEVKPGMASTADEIKVDVPDDAKPAAEALKKFLAATTLSERLKYTLAADALKPLMERYYSLQADGPIRVDAIGLVRLDKKPQIGGGAHAVFGVESKTWEFPIPVMLEQGKNGFQVDWLSFVEFKDRLLENFFQGYQEGPARFHVGITRTHYFDDKVPNSDNKDAFRIGPAPPNPYQTTVFVDKDSSIGRDLRDRIPWGTQVWAIVELEWVKLGTQQWVQLAGVPQLNWYSVPTSPKMAPRRDSSVVPTETQRAVPVGR